MLAAPMPEGGQNLWSTAAHLPAPARRALARGLLSSSGPSAKRHVTAAADPHPYEAVNLHTELLTQEEVAAQLDVLLERARCEGAQAAMVRVGPKGPAAAVIASGDHVWELARLALGLQEALDALACSAVAAFPLTTGASATVEGLLSDADRPPA